MFNNLLQEIPATNEDNDDDESAVKAVTVTEDEFFVNCEYVLCEVLGVNRTARSRCVQVKLLSESDKTKVRKKNLNFKTFTIGFF